MFYANVSCVTCQSSAFIEYYEGADLTCSTCGAESCVEPIQSTYSFAILEECLFEDEEDNEDKENSVVSVETQMRDDILSLKQETLKMNLRRFRIPRYKPY